MRFNTVGELVDYLNQLPRDTTIAVSDYYYDIQEGVLEGIFTDCLVHYDGVLYIDTKYVSCDSKTGIPLYRLHKEP
jgi:hypothetical protein